MAIRTSPATNSPGSVLKGIDLIRSLLKANPKTGRPQLRIHKRCVHLIEEMRKYRWCRRRSVSSLTTTAAPQAQPLKRDDDTVCAMRYAIQNATYRDGMALGSATSKPEEVRADMQLDRLREATGARPTLVPLMKMGSQRWFAK